MRGYVNSRQSDPYVDKDSKLTSLIQQEFGYRDLKTRLSLPGAAGTVGISTGCTLRICNTPQFYV